MLVKNEIGKKMRMALQTKGKCGPVCSGHWESRFSRMEIGGGIFVELKLVVAHNCTQYISDLNEWLKLVLL